jgi:hypothetical protein
LRLYDLAFGSRSYDTFTDWYHAVRDRYIGTPTPDGSGWLTLYEDTALGINHRALVAGPWALTVWYLLPIDQVTALAIWRGFKHHFVRTSDTGAYVSVHSDTDREDIRATGLALSIAHEIEDEQQLEPLRRHAESRYEPRSDGSAAEFAFWFGLNEPHPRGQWNNAIMPAFIGSAGTWRRAFEQELR